MEIEKDLLTLISRGYKMEAVKMLRLYYSVDLITAKKMVDEWEMEHDSIWLSKRSLTH